MDYVTLDRFAYTPLGTFGELELGDTRLFTIELPWRGNKPNISCIPTGGYMLKLAMFHKSTADPSDDYPTYEIAHVPNRSLIKFHVANTPADLLGCVGVGKRLGVVKGQWGVLDSQDAFDEFMSAMNGVPAAYINIRLGSELMFV